MRKCIPQRDVCRQPAKCDQPAQSFAAGSADPSDGRDRISFEEIRDLAPRIGADAAESARLELLRLRRAWNAADRRIGYSASLAKAQDLARFEGIAGRVLISLQPYYIHDIAAKLHCMLVMYDPELRKEETPWPELRRMLRELIQPHWSVIEPQSRIRLLRPKTRERRFREERDRIAV